MPLSFLSAEANAELDRLIREVVTELAARPTHVSQRTCMAVLGLPKRDFLDAVRRGDFPSRKIRRVLLAKTEDVLAWFESRPLRSPRVAIDLPADATAEDRALARVGARRVGPR